MAYSDWPRYTFMKKPFPINNAIPTPPFSIIRYSILYVKKIAGIAFRKGIENKYVFKKNWKNQDVI